jgi:hypothetical protein
MLRDKKKCMYNLKINKCVQYYFSGNTYNSIFFDLMYMKEIKGNKNRRTRIGSFIFFMLDIISLIH